MTSLAIVGLGRWGKVLVDAVQRRSESVRFVAAVGRDPATIADAAARRGLTVHRTLKDAVGDPAVDGIVLASPHSLHAGQIACCIRGGKPVLVEKPFTLTRESAEQALAAAAAAGILVTAAHNRRFLAPIVALRRMIAEGVLGTILHIETNFSGNAAGRYAPDSWRLAPGESPAGGLAGSGIHHIDTIIFLESMIREVFAITTRRIPDLPLDDTAAVLFRLVSGATGSLLTMTATAPCYRVQVFGTQARAEINGAADKRGSEIMVVTTTGGQRTEQAFPPVDLERAELEAFAAAVRGEAEYPITPAEILNGVAAFEAVQEAARRNAPVTVAA